MYFVNKIGWMAAWLVVAWLGWQMVAPPVYGQPGTAAVQNGNDVIAIKLEGDQTGERVMIVDTRQRAIAVYHVGRERGEIRLESVRNIRGDLQLTGFNTESPTPDEVRQGLERG